MSDQPNNKTVTINNASIKKNDDNFIIEALIKKQNYDILSQTIQTLSGPDSQDSIRVVNVKILNITDNEFVNLAGIIKTVENSRDLKIILDTNDDSYGTVGSFTGNVKIDITVNTKYKDNDSVVKAITTGSISNISKYFISSINRNVFGYTPITITIKQPIEPPTANGGKLRKSRKYRKDKKPKNGGKSRKNKKSGSKKRR